MYRCNLRPLFQCVERMCAVLIQSGKFQRFESHSTWSAVMSSCSRRKLLVAKKKQWLHTSGAIYVSQKGKPTELSSAQLQKQDDQYNQSVQGLGSEARKEVEEEVLPEGTLQGNPASAGPIETDPLQDKSIGLFQRFKKTFKQYGKVMIPVHLVTSSLWFGTFYYAAMKGVNVVPFLEYVGLPDSIVNILRNSQSGNALTAYAMYKIATPARYAVTLGGTSVTVKYLRKQGYMSTPPPMKDYLQDKMEETKELFTGKMEETKGIISEKMEETKDRISEKLQETKDRFPLGKKK
ncbi:protein FAM210A [Protopterus annectens]|uniref:protein FAM210A n=1 Tax=Protopterus annectens TaxID=7888 RepID=UPI001CFA8E74|nr:protein FAM210A [Protopterus annectens]